MDWNAGDFEIVVIDHATPPLKPPHSLRQRRFAGDSGVLLDPETAAFPGDALSSMADVRLYRRAGFESGRFIHAKALIALTESADHLLVGSANCTRAALGVQNYAGANEEACLYRRLPPGTVLEALSLTARLTDENLIAPVDLSPHRYEEDSANADQPRRTSIQVLPVEGERWPSVAVLPRPFALPPASTVLPGRSGAGVERAIERRQVVDLAPFYLVAGARNQRCLLGPRCMLPLVSKEQ